MTQIAEKNPTEVVVELCQALEQGDKARLGELEPLLQRRQHEMAQGLGGFLSQTEARGEAFEQRFAEEIAEVEKNFMAYDEALKQIGAYLKDKRAEHLQAGSAALIEAAGRLRFAMQRYEEKFLSEGQSRFPQVNFLNNVSAGVIAGRTPSEAYTNACERFLDFYRGVVDEIDKSSAKDKPGVAARRAAAVSIGETLEKLHKTGGKGNAQELEALMADFARGLNDLEDALEVYETEAVANYPSPLPQANYVYHSARNVLEGRLPGENLHTLAEGYLSRVQAAIAEVQGLSHVKNESVLLKEESTKVIEALEDLEDCLLVLVSYGEGQDVKEEDVEATLVRFVEAAKRLHESNQTVLQFNDAQNKVPDLPGLQRSQLKGLREMAGDFEQSSFQVMEGASAVADDYILTTKIKAVFDSCYAHHQNPSPETAAAFENVLETTERDLEKAMREFGAIEFPEFEEDAPEEARAAVQPIVDYAREAKTLMEEGSREVREGLAILKGVLENPNEEQQGEGLKRYFFGAQKMLKVHKVVGDYNNWARETYPEAIEEPEVTPGEGEEPPHDPTLA